MNTFLLILVLTVIYYIVLFYFDNKRKKAFQLAKNNAIGKTTELPIIEQTKPEGLFRLKYGTGFGSTDSLDKPTEVALTTIGQKAIAAKNVVYQHSAKHLKEDLDELAIHLDGQETIELPKTTLIESLQNASDKELIGEEEISAFIQSPKLTDD